MVLFWGGAICFANQWQKSYIYIKKNSHSVRKHLWCENDMFHLQEGFNKNCYVVWQNTHCSIFFTMAAQREMSSLFCLFQKLKKLFSHKIIFSDYQHIADTIKKTWNTIKLFTQEHFKRLKWLKWWKFQPKRFTLKSQWNRSSDK